MTAKKRTKPLSEYCKTIRKLSRKPGLLLTIALVALALVIALPGVGLAETVVATVPVGYLPKSAGVNPATNKIYVANYNSGNVSVINGATDTVSKIVPVGTGPFGVGVNPATNKIYVTNFNSNNVSVIDGAADTVSKTVAVGTGPVGVGVNPATNRIYITNFNSNDVSVIDGATDTVDVTVPVGIGPIGIGVNPTTNKVYEANSVDGNVLVMDGATYIVSTAVPVGASPIGVGVDPTINKIYVANNSDDTVSVIEGGTDTVSTTVPVGSSPFGVGVNPTTNKVYVVNGNDDNVSVIDGGTDIMSTTVPVGTDPYGIGVNPATNKIYVANQISDNVTVIQGDPTTWYLAEGTTAWGFSTYISIENPNDAELQADITYNTSDGPVSGGTLNLPPMSQTTVNPGEVVPNTDFSTYIEVPTGETIAVDRTMQWTGEGASAPEAHNSIGVTSPAETWYLPEGSSAWGFECWLLIQNPDDTREATCQVTYMIEGEGPTTVEKKVPAGSRKTYNMADDIGNKDASIKVDSNVPVIPERAMYRYNRREGHDSIGTTDPATDYYLAEGAVGYDSGYLTYVLIQNPQDETNRVTLTYLTGSGDVAGPTIDMPPNSRTTIRVNDQLPPNTDVSTHVHGDKPIIAERAMYWNSPAGEASHDSIGMNAPHSVFYLPDGQSSEGRETWTLIANPDDHERQVGVHYLPEGGGTTVLKEEFIPANSRRTFNMAEHSGISGRASIMVVAGTGGRVMVERAMYWNDRAAGTDTIGGYSNPNTMITVKNGDDFEIVLDSNPSTGFSWELTQPLDSSILRFESKRYENYAPPGVYGSPGKEHWQFNTLKAGSSRISLQYKQSWEKDKAPAETAYFTVNVTE